jgi:hypothetical protein
MLNLFALSQDNIISSIRGQPASIREVDWDSALPSTDEVGAARCILMLSPSLILFFLYCQPDELNQWRPCLPLPATSPRAVLVATTKSFALSCFNASARLGELLND